MSEPRKNARSRTTYIVEARCQDCEDAREGPTDTYERSWTIDDLDPDDWADAFEEVGEDVRHWLSDHHENTHTEEQ